MVQPCTLLGRTPWLHRAHTHVPSLCLPISLQHLPKELRPAAQAAKKRAARVQERVSVMSVALRLLRAHGDGKAAPKLCKALDALQRAKVRGAGVQPKLGVCPALAGSGTAVPWCLPWQRQRKPACRRS